MPAKILAALALMYLVYFPHGGPGVLGTYGDRPASLLDILTPVAVPFFASVYGLVRGCDNIVTGLRA